MDSKVLEILITVSVTLGASSGFWSYIIMKNSKKSAGNRLLMGLAHDRIVTLAEGYIQRGYITADEYENLHDYLYSPYRDLNGNGSAERAVIQCKSLPNSIKNV